jgi:hypothetical protein
MDPVTILSSLVAFVQIGGDISAAALQFTSVLKAKGAITDAQWREVITAADLSDKTFDEWFATIKDA